MLNEYKEYFDYTHYLNVDESTTKPGQETSDKLGRLRLETITKKHGLSRVLEVIARRVLFHDLNNIENKIILNKENKNQRINYAFKALNNWCQNNEQHNPVLNELIGDETRKGKYVRYMEQALSAYKTNKTKDNKQNESTNIKSYNNIKAALDDWERYLGKVLNVDYYSRRMHSDNSELKTLNQLMTFDLIIANALNQGPLNHRVVYFPKNQLQKIVDKLNLEKHYTFITNFIITASYYTVLKTINPSNEFQLIKNTDMSNWMNKNYSTESAKWEKKLSIDYVKFKTLMGNVRKLWISDELIEGVIVDTIQPNEKPNEKKDYILISDDQNFQAIDLVVKSLHNV